MSTDFATMKFSSYYATGSTRSSAAILPTEVARIHSLLPESPHSQPYLHRVQSGIVASEPRIRYVQISHGHAPVIFFTENVHAQCRARREIHRVRVHRNIFITEKRSAAQFEVWRKTTMSFKIPLQYQRIKSPGIRCLHRLINQVHRNDIHRIFKPTA